MLWHDAGQYKSNPSLEGGRFDLYLYKWRHVLRQSGVRVRAVRPLRRSSECADAVRQAGLLQTRPRAWALPDGRLGARLTDVRGLGPLVVVVSHSRSVSPVSIGIVHLLAVDGDAWRRSQWMLPVILAGSAQRGAVVFPAAAHGHLGGGQPHLALQVGVVVGRHLGVVWGLLRHGVGIEGAADGMAVMSEREAVVPSIVLGVGDASLAVRL